MQNIHKTRFIAANYSNLQGLKAVPLGLLLIIVVLWANGLTGRAANLTLPILFAVGFAVITWLVYRYYQGHFGKVERTPKQKQLERVLGVVGGVVALGAFALDTSRPLPISLTGLVFAVAIVAEYLRMQWYAPGHYLLPAAVFFSAVMVAASILPLLGFHEWWRLLGLRIQLYGVLVVAGVVLVSNGFLGHWFFLRQLPEQER